MANDRLGDVSDAGPSQGPPTAPGLPLDFADLPEGRVKFQHRRNEYERLRKKFMDDKEFRPDMKAMKEMNDKKISYRYTDPGSTPGVEVGDTFEYRSEMFVVGLHQVPVSGICCVDRGARGDKIVTSIVASGGYEDNNDQGDTLIYSGQGGNDYGGSKHQIADQSQSLRNAAMRRSMELRLPVRVIRGLNVEGRRGSNKTYSYDGLYTVIREILPPAVGKSGHRVYQFVLRRSPGQPDINITRVRFGGDEAH